MRKALQWLGILAFCCLGYTVQAQINTFPYFEDFETFGTCNGGNNCGVACSLPVASGWENPTAGDDNDWLANQGTTPTGSTGPNADHTLGTNAGTYIYVEASASCHPSKRADLLSPVFDFTSELYPRVTFWYHMRGNNMGTTSIDISTDGGATWTNDIVTPITDNIDLWQEYTLNLYDVGGTSYGGMNNIRLRFRGITGTVNWESDMAMDDFSVTSVPALDAALTTFTNPVTPICGSANQNVTVTLVNQGGSTLTSADINWTVNGTPQTTFNFSGSLASNASTNLTLGSIPINDGDVISATVSNPNGGTDGNNSNDNISNTYFFGLSGTYTIGGPAGPTNYTDFTSAVSDLITSGVCGPVIFNAASNTYNENIVIDDIPGVSSVNNITFQSASGNSADVELRHFATGGADNYAVRFDGGSHITFRHMTIANTGNNYSRVLVYNQGSSYINIDSCVIEGNINVTNNSNNRITIYSGDHVNDFCTFTDNVIQGGSYYMFLDGENNGARETGTVIRNNTFQFAYYRGLDLRYHEETEIVGNDITIASSYTGNTRWIELRDMGHIEVAYNNLTGTNRGYAFDCNNCDAPAGNPSYIYNNSIYVGRISGTNVSRGIFMENSERNYIENNSIHVENNNSASVGIYVNGNGNINHINNNNILITGFGIGLRYDDASDIASSNNNNVFVTSAFGNFGFSDGSLRPSLADWQAATGFDGNTLNLDPQYYSRTDLRSCETALRNAGIPITYLTDDITRAPRVGLPDIGAYELVELSFSLGADTAKCIGDPVTLAVPDATRFTGFSWNTGATTDDITVTAPGTYHVTATAVCGTSVDTIVVTDIPNPVAAFSSTTSFQTANFTDASANADSYSWDFGDGNTSVMQSPSHTYAAENTYIVELTASNVCASDVASDTIDVCLPIDVDFNSSSTGLSVNFSDATSTAVTNWAWDFGDGNSSTLQNPTHSYAADGIYSVQLIVTNPCGDQDSISQSVTVCGPISASFTQAVVDRTINFSDNSSGTPTSWAWDFGDGSTSTLQNPSHTYSSDGIYDVTLTVTNLCGQTSTSAITTFTVCAPITADIIATNTGLSASFTDNSSGTPTAWAWDFGDGNNSTLQNPSHAYAADGNYTVSLTVTNLCGQTSTTSTVVSSCEPMTADFNEVITNRTIDFTDNTSGTPTAWAWDFGDGNTATTQNPSHTYTSDATYTVSLTTTNTCGETASTTETFTVCEALTAGINSTQTDRTVNFTDNTVGSPTAWAWDFGDGNIDNGQNPQHTYAADGAYTVQLIATNLCGIADTVTISVTVCAPMTADFSTSNTGLNTSFADNTSGTPTTWAWDFGDGNSSTLQNPTHNYATDGAYTVTLTTTNFCGQTSSEVQVVTVCAPMTASFTKSTTNLLTTFVDGSSGNPSAWSWTFGDGNSSTAQNPTHTYGSDGIYTVTLIATNFCGETSNTTDIVDACAPITADFSHTTTGLTANFTDASAGTPVSWAWDFGDGNTATSENPNHTYIADGNYTVNLTVTNICGQTSTTSITVDACAAMIADFSRTTTGLTANFTDASTGMPVSWAWDFGDGNTATTQNPSHTYATDSTYTVTLTTTNTCGVTSTETEVITLCGNLTADLSQTSNFLTVDFSDVSTGTPVSWFWDFGDGNSSALQNPTHTYGTDGSYNVVLTVTNSCGQSSTSAPLSITVCDTLAASFNQTANNLVVDFSSTTQGNPTTLFWNFGDGNTATGFNPTHTYAVDDTYNVQLTASNLCGQVSSSTILPLTVCDEMVADFSSSSTNLAVNFTDNTSGTPTAWAWDFGDGNTATGANPSHTYAADGTYTVTLVTTNLCGLTSSYTETVTVCDVLTAAFSEVANERQLAFTDNTLGTPTTWAWDFDDNNTSTAQNPTHSYGMDGTYTITLVATNLCGQTSTDSTTVTVCDSMQTSFGSNQNALTVAFSDLTTASPVSWAWDFGDGNTATTQNPTHTYATDGIYTVELIAINFCGQADTSTATVTVCDAINADFTTLVSGQTIILNDNSTGNVDTYFWNFGDGNTSTAANPTHTYASSGPYSIVLTVTNLCGVSSTETTTVSVCGAVAASFTANNNDLTINTTNTTTGGAINYAWDFGDGVGTSTLTNPNYTYATDGTYNITLIASSACGTADTSAPVAVTVCAPITADYNSSVSNLTVTLSDATAGNPTGWTWDFGDGSGTSTLQNPIYTYSADGIYDVELIVQNLCGDLDTMIQTVTVCNTIGAGFTFSNSGLNVSFTDTSQGTPTSYAWNFGDNVGSSTAANPSYTYVQDGAYPVTLTTTNSCGTSSFTDTITICSPMAANFSHTVGGLGRTINFSNSSSGFPASYFWDFGNGSTSTAVNPTHIYSSDGVYTVSLQTVNICGDTSTVTQSINACQTLLPAFSLSATDLSITTNNSTQGIPTAYAWDFGDGTTSTAIAPSHTYSMDGTYNIVLTVTNTCGQTATDSVSLTACGPMLANAAAADTALTVAFSDNSSGTPVDWTWDFGDGNNSSLQNPVHTYATDGSYPINLLVTNLCGDTSSYNFTLTVCDSMQAGFASNSSDLSASFLDLSTGNPTSWTWDFGDGNSSTLASPTHTYATDGSYIVSLTSSNFCGNSSTTTDTIELCAPLMANMGYSNTGLTADFSDISMGTATSWIWDFGDGNSSTTANPTHTYAADGDYEVILTATNFCGASSSDTLNITICADLIADFTFTSTERTFDFINNSQGNATSTSWTFGDGVGASTQQSPSYTYPVTGQFTVTLTLTNFCGATSTATDTVNAFLTDVEEQPTTTAKLKLFPNPNDGQFTLALEDWPANEALELQLFDVFGQVVWMNQLDEVQSSEQLRLDVTQLPAGTYVLRAMAGSTVMTYQVVIRR